MDGSVSESYRRQHRKYTHNQKGWDGGGRRGMRHDMNRGRTFSKVSPSVKELKRRKEKRCKTHELYIIFVLYK